MSKPPFQMVHEMECKVCGQILPYTREYFPPCQKGKYLLKTCRKCWNKHHKDYLASKGEDFCKKLRQKYYLSTRENHIFLAKRLYQEKREQILKQKQEYKAKNRDRYNQNARIRYWTDNKVRIESSLRSLMRRSIKDKNYRSWESLVGYNIDSLSSHLESLFLEGMTMDNYGDWHIDHIKPRRYFNYDSCEDTEFKECWALDNLRPLWAIDNIRRNYG